MRYVRYNSLKWLICVSWKKSLHWLQPQMVCAYCWISKPEKVRTALPTLPFTPLQRTPRTRNQPFDQYELLNSSPSNTGFNFRHVTTLKTHVLLFVASTLSSVPGLGRSRATWSVPRRSCWRDRHRSPESHLGSTRPLARPGAGGRIWWNRNDQSSITSSTGWCSHEKNLLEGNVENGLWLNKICWRYSFEYFFRLPGSHNPLIAQTYNHKAFPGRC